MLVSRSARCCPRSCSRTRRAQLQVQRRKLRRRKFGEILTSVLSSYVVLLGVRAPLHERLRDFAILFVRARSGHIGRRYDDAENRRAIPEALERVSLMWSVSDEALLAGLASGESDAAVAFIRRFQRRVYGLAMTILSDPAAAEDVAQETFARAWRHAGSYDPRRGPVATWLLTIARNLAIDALRLRRADPVDPTALVSLQGISAEAGPEERAVVGDDAHRLHDALRALPEDQRRALV